MKPDELTITLADLRRVLGECVDVGYVNQYASHRILELARQEAVKETDKDNENL